jgi:Xaa-Pro aminopeptidase
MTTSAKKERYFMLFNKSRLITLMDQFELDAVVASSAENIFYLSGFSSWSQHAYHYENVQVYVVFPRDESQSPALLIPGGDLGYAALKEVWIEEICNYGRKRTPKVLENADLSPEEKRIIVLSDQTPKDGKPEEALSILLREKGLQNSRIGVDQAGVPLQSMETIRSLLPGSKILLASNFFRYVRMIKTDDEIERLKQTAKLNEIAATAMLNQAGPGVSEDEVASAYRREIARVGGRNFLVTFYRKPRL